MRKLFLLIFPFAFLPIVAIATDCSHIINATPCITVNNIVSCPPVPSKPKNKQCVQCPKPNQDLAKIADELHTLNVSSMQDLKTAVEDVKGAIEKQNCCKQKSPEIPDHPPFTNDGWLTLLVILLALSAYMATLRWMLIDKCGKENNRQEFYKQRINSIDTVDLKKAGLSAGDKDILDQEKAGLSARIDKSIKEYCKHQKKIRTISFVDLLLSLSALFIIYSIFHSYVLSPSNNADYFGVLLFLAAIFFFLILHFLEWVKALCKMVEMRDKCK